MTIASNIKTIAFCAGFFIAGAVGAGSAALATTGHAHLDYRFTVTNMTDGYSVADRARLEEIASAADMAGAAMQPALIPPTKAAVEPKPQHKPQVR